MTPQEYPGFHWYKEEANPSPPSSTMDPNVPEILGLVPKLSHSYHTLSISQPGVTLQDCYASHQTQGGRGNQVGFLTHILLCKTLSVSNFLLASWVWSMLCSIGLSGQFFGSNLSLLGLGTHRLQPPPLGFKMASSSVLSVQPGETWFHSCMKVFAAQLWVSLEVSLISDLSIPRHTTGVITD